jgi:16S rRNA (adenine1518-N6/adenine1519-N6)-dimethyltransferase
MKKQPQRGVEGEAPAGSALAAPLYGVAGGGGDASPYKLTRAKKSLGQNFLIDPNYKKKIATAVLSSKPVAALEIGPGLGAITDLLGTGGFPLILAEKDTRFVEGLTERHPTAVILNEDFMDVDLTAALHDLPKPITVVGNLPYNVASQIFIRLLDHHTEFSDLFLMFQKEVALRLTAKHDTRDYGLLALWAHYFTEAKILFHLPPSVFQAAS